MKQTFFQVLFGIEPSHEEIKVEMEEDSEENYQKHKLQILKEAREFRNKFRNKNIKHCPEINRMFNVFGHTDIDKLELKDLFLLGFNSSHLTRKHCEELGL